LPSPAGLRPASRLNQNLADSGIYSDSTQAQRALVGLMAAIFILPEVYGFEHD
jgi:hypothetical protein